MSDTYLISLRIHDESELYCSFDKDRLTLSDDVADYLFSRFKEKKYKDKPVIQIIADTDIDKAHLYKAFDKYIDSLRLQLDKEKKINCIKQLWMAVVGILFIAFGLYATSFLPALLGEIISTVGAFAMWEAASIWIVENPQNRLKRKWLKHLTTTELTFERAELSAENPK